jgi:hypothetical protein
MKLWVLLLTLLCYGFSPIPDNEKVSSLLEGNRLVNSLVEIERRGLNEGRSLIDLWSGSYWPHYQGSLGVRYRDPNFISLMERKAQWDKFKEMRDKFPIYTYEGKEKLLSPAEKYDLLIGDEQMSLTKYSWELGEKIAGVSGKVPTWRGVCDGWASAAQMMPRPKRSVTLSAPNGVSLTFFPEDIKALGSLLYARAQENVIFLGKRCRSQVLGLITGACVETNPGTFHLALVNRVGLMKKTFIADISPGSEVWNYPVKSYKFTYYNVFSGEESQDFKKVRELFTKKNRFSRSSRRHKDTFAIVGVKAEVIFTDMRTPNLFETDGSSMDNDLQMTYSYDLELDSSMNILGGESSSKNLPDFIWAPHDGTYPLSRPEQTLGIPRTQGDLVKRSQEAAKLGQPLSVIVERLFEAAK